MESIPLSVIALFVGSVIVQLAGQTLWPTTRGFTRFGPTLAACIAQVIGLWLFNRVVVSGVALSLLVPLAGAVFPLAVVFVGLVVHREKASPRKVGMLLSACALIGAASFV